MSKGSAPKWVNEKMPEDDGDRKVSPDLSHPSTTGKWGAENRDDLWGDYPPEGVTEQLKNPRCPRPCTCEGDIE